MDPPVASWRKLTFVEPVTFFIMFAFSLSDSLITDSVIYKTCVIKKFSNDCSILYKNSSSNESIALQNEIQPYTATFFITQTSIETLFPTIMMLFLGPWSDTNGRKPLLTFPFLGSIFYYSLFSILSSFNIDPHWFLIGSLVSSLMGGFPSILLTCFCYIADVTSEENRASRLGFLDFVLFGGQLIGLLVSPALFKGYGFCVVFAISAFSCVLGLLYSFFFLKETIYTGTGRSIKTLFDYTTIKDLIRFIVKKRSGFDRCLFYCCLLIIAIHDDNMQGSAKILYLFTKRFGWNIFDFSMYSAIHLAITMVGMMLLIKFIAPFLNLRETLSIMIASLSNCGNSIAKAFAKEKWHMYLASGIGMFSLAPASLVRSIITKTVPKQEVGKAFAVTTTMEKIGPFATTPLFVLLHTNFIKAYPSPVWFLPAGLSLIIVILAIIVHRRWKAYEKKRFVSEIVN